MVKVITLHRVVSSLVLRFDLIIQNENDVAALLMMMMLVKLMVFEMVPLPIHQMVIMMPLGPFQLTKAHLVGPSYSSLMMMHPSTSHR
jgi:hypothetical protein